MAAIIKSKISAKASSRIAINRTLIGVVIGVFFLTINLREELLFQKVLALQLVLAIPLLLTSMFAYAKIGYRKKTKRWNTLGWITFIISYSFLLNIIGILLGDIIDKGLSVIFFISSWILIVIYSLVDISYDKNVITERIIKDGLFILITLVLGLLVVLGVVA